MHELTAAAMSHPQHLHHAQVHSRTVDSALHGPTQDNTEVMLLQQHCFAHAILQVQKTSTEVLTAKLYITP
jgi:hypothetical protein